LKLIGLTYDVAVGGRQKNGVANFVIITFVLRMIECASQELCDPKRSIIGAGLDAGFLNPSHFTRVFRKLDGTTPSQFPAHYI
jgi:AraC-like DNA-binding protein